MGDVTSTRQICKNINFSLVFRCFLAVREGSWEVLGRLGAVLGGLGTVLGGLGAVLGRLGVVLGASWGVLGRSWGVLLRPHGKYAKTLIFHRFFQCFFGCPKGVLGGLGASWGGLGESWGRP